MEPADQNQSQRAFWAFILALLLLYAGYKMHHVSYAIAAYQDQVLLSDTSGAAK